MSLVLFSVLFLFVFFKNVPKSEEIMLDSKAESLEAYMSVEKLVKCNGEINVNKRQWAIIKPINETHFGMNITGLLKIKTESDILNLSSIFNALIASDM